jgi:hypothetical protein
MAIETVICATEISGGLANQSRFEKSRFENTREADTGLPFSFGIGAKKVSEESSVMPPGPRLGCGEAPAPG